MKRWLGAGGGLVRTTPLPAKEDGHARGEGSDLQRHATRREADAPQEQVALHDEPNAH